MGANAAGIYDGGVGTGDVLHAYGDIRFDSVFTNWEILDLAAPSTDTPVKVASNTLNSFNKITGDDSWPNGRVNLLLTANDDVDFGAKMDTGTAGISVSVVASVFDGNYTFQGTNSIVFSQLGIDFEDDLTQQQRDAINARGGPDAALISVNQQVNADGILKVRGWELIWVQPLNIITRGLGVMANYTDIKLTPSGKDAARLGSSGGAGVIPTFPA